MTLRISPNKTSCKPPMCTDVTLSPPGSHTVDSPDAGCSVRPAAHASPYHALPMGMTQQFFCFFLFPVTWPVTFKLWRDFCTTYLTAKFDDPTFSRSEVIVRTNKQTHTLTNKQTPLKTSTLLRYAMPVGKHRTCIFTGSRWPMPMINSFRLISITQISRSHDP